MSIDTLKVRIGALPGRVALSAALHCAAIGLLAYKSHGYIAPMLMPGDMHGTQMTLTYLPGRAPQAASVADPKAPVKPVEIADLKVVQPRIAIKMPMVQHATANSASQTTAASPNAKSPASVSPDSASGADALGTGNINIAYLDSFRSPRPDLSSLPRGTSGEVVLDITIDTTGRIVGLKKLSGVGYGVDESVIATVQAWIFHPATKDGTPVVSEQELHFHYERGRSA